MPNDIRGKDLEVMVTALKKREPRALSKAITLLESKKKEDQSFIRALLEVLPREQYQTYRLGVSGPPGVGKSTFLNALVMEILTSTKDDVAILTVDPTSSRSGGSILGDKTRMNDVASDKRVFIRPSPSGEAFDGTATSTREAILLCEEAGFRWILVETVGVGQLDAEVRSITDFFMFLTQPSAGDEIQQIKRGNMEWADALVVNKKDGTMEKEAAMLVDQLRVVSTFYRITDEEDKISVFGCSALNQTGVKQIYHHVERKLKQWWQQGVVQERRTIQNQIWFSRQLQHDVMHRVLEMSRLQEVKKDLELKVLSGDLTVYHALSLMNKELDRYLAGEANVK